MALEYGYATEMDISEIASIEADSMSNPWKEADYFEAINSDHAFVTVAKYEKVIIGYAVFYLTTPESELPDIVIEKNHRGMGVGMSLLTFSISELKKSGIETVFLEVRESNLPARKLYENIGFEIIGKRKYFYSNPIEDAICMSLQI